MTTALDLINSAAQSIGVLRKSEDLDNDEASDGLVALNRMISSWSNDSLLIYARTLESFTLATSSLSYLLGPSQTLNTTRPVKIVHASIRSNGTDYDLEIIGAEEFESIPVKSVQGSPSDVMTYDNGYPYMTLRFYTLPAVGDILRLLSEKVLTSFSALDTTVDLPPGYEEAIQYNLAFRLVPTYGVPMPPEILLMAKESLGSIKLAVAKNRPMPHLPSGGQPYSILTGVDS